jgi:prepilin signal peptidase PulO-like enzyme (type II secretory pathway)
MYAITLLWVFIFGTIIGSFLNVVALRYNTGRSINGRSACFSCGHKLSWYELVPLFSFIASLGKCRSCKSKISWQYPLVEALTGILFVLLFNYFGLTLHLLFWVILVSLLIVIGVYDLRHKIIPDGLVYAFSIIALLGHVLLGEFNFWFVAAGIILFIPFFFLWFISKGKWIGLGDGKLALGFGFALGLVDGISAIVLAFWIGAVVSVLLLAFKGKQLTIKSEIPFGPFLILGFLLILFFGWDVVGLRQLLLLSL